MKQISTIPCFFFLVPFFLLLGGCAFVNTLYNGGMAYRLAQQDEKNMLRTGQDSAEIFRATEADYVRAVEKAEKALIEYPNAEKAHDDAYYLQGISLYQLGDYQGAIISLEILGEFYPNSKHYPLSLLWLAKAHHKNEAWDEANDILLYMLERYPAMANDQEVILLQTNLAIELQGKGEAIAVLEKRLTQVKDPTQRLYLIDRLTSLYMDLKQYDHALEHLQNLPPYDKKNSGIFYRVDFRQLQCLAALQQWEDAIELADVMLQNNQYLFNRSEILLEKGIILIAYGEYDTADEILDEVTQGKARNETKGHAWYERAGISIDIRNDLDTGKVQLETAASLVTSPELKKAIAQRLKGLNTIAQLQEQLLSTDTTVIADSLLLRYRIGETYWLDARLPDSALLYFDTLATNIAAPDTIRSKALYSKGWILAEIKKDTAASQKCFEDVIAQFPTTEAAKESQKHLGQEVTIVLRKDSAQIQFEIAENLREDNNGEYNKDVYYAYLLCALKYPDIHDIAARALYVAGIVINTRAGKLDEVVDTAAAKIFVRLCDDYPESEQCLEVQKMMEINAVKGFTHEYAARKDSTEIIEDLDTTTVSEEKSADKKPTLPDFESWL